MNCQLFRRHVGAFVDGELDAATAVEFETHVESCEPCLEHLEFEAVTREHLRDALVQDVQVPAHLADRVRTALDEEDERSSVVPHDPFIPIRWRIALPLSAAAALGIFVLAANDAQVKQSESLALDVVRVHSAGLPSDVDVETESLDPIEVTSVAHGGGAAPNRRPERRQVGDEVARYFRGKVRFPVRPAEFAARDVRLVGARLSNVRERQAAALYYDVGGRRLTVVVTDAPVESSAEPVEVEGRQIFFRDVQGYSVPVRQEAGIRYAFTGDVDRDRLLQLAASARMP